MECWEGRCGIDRREKEIETISLRLRQKGVRGGVPKTKKKT